MSDTGKGNAERYMSGLLHYLSGGGETALQSAYELGRESIASGMGGLDMLAIHQKCLASALQTARSAPESARIVEQSGSFFSESLSTFEMELRGFREANSRLTSNVEILRKTETELLEQYAKLLSAHQALETERRRYRDLFDFAPDGYLVTDLDGVIEEANRAAGALLGVPSESLPGTRLLDWVAGDARREFATRLSALLPDETGKAQNWRFEARTHSGACFPATLGIRVMKNAEGKPEGLRMLLRDVTESKRMEEERASIMVREQVARAQLEAARRFAFLAEVSALLVVSLDCESTLSSVAGVLVPYLADSCLIYLMDSDGRIRLISGSHADPARSEQASRLSRDPFTLNPQSRIARVLAGVQAEIFSPLRPDSQEAPQEPLGFLFDAKFESLLLVPIQTHRRVLGLIALAADRPDFYTSDHAALAVDLAQRCALAVDNAQLYRAMVAERDKAAEANRAKDEFLAILGHELRNPLVPILGWSRRLPRNRSVAEDASLSQGVEAIERNALSILRLADDCLDLVRISERRVALKRELLDLNETVNGAIEGLRQTAREKGLGLSARLSSPALWVWGDRMRLEQVINNLLINAFKYTGGGGVISVSSKRIGNEGDIEITDTGIGIAPEFLEQVFQPFRRVSRESFTSDAGLGLGLAIARKIVELHGGTIWAESPGLGGGSSFHVRLALSPAREATPQPDLGISELVPPTPLRVLLIDDQKDLLDLMMMDLESSGYSVMTAPNGQRGLEMAISYLPDVIVSDLKLPGIDGYELIRRLRRIPAVAAVPAVAHSGLGMKDAVEAALAAGYDAHLSKPADVRVLSDLIQRLMNERPGGQKGIGPGRGQKQVRPVKTS